MSLPPRHAHLIRVDPCHPWFQNAIHQRSDELDVNPRSVVSSSANDGVHRAAANDIDFKSRAARGSVCNALFATISVLRPNSISIGKYVCGKSTFVLLYAFAVFPNPVPNTVYDSLECVDIILEFIGR
jgi:hypothetical protein